MKHPKGYWEQRLKELDAEIAAIRLKNKALYDLQNGTVSSDDDYDLWRDMKLGLDASITARYEAHELGRFDLK